MHRTLSQLGPVVVALLLVTGCGNALGPSGEVLVREAWEWDSACCGIAGDARTPETEGYLYVLRFARDGTVRAVRNDTLLVETTFSVRRRAPVDFGDEVTEITYGQPLPLGPGIAPTDRQMVILLEGGRLLLRALNACADCYGDWAFTPRLE